MDAFWLTHGKLITPRGIVGGAVKISRGRIAAIQPKAPRGAATLSMRGGYVAPGFIDLHVWGDPAIVAHEAVRHGTTSFLTSLGPDAPRTLLKAVRARAAQGRCLGIHLEGPFLNPARGGALPKRRMRRPTVAELSRLAQAAGGALKLITVAPELDGAAEAIRWCAQHRITVSLGHSQATAADALHAIDAGASTVTHIFNGMAPFHHREPGLLDVALTDPRLTAMVILDGVHVSAYAFRLLVRAKGPGGVALVTDSIRHEGWTVTRRRGAYYLPAPRAARQAGTANWVLAGSGLTMMRAVRNAVIAGGVALADAVRMASETPARVLGLRDRGALALGRRADLVIFDRRFSVQMTMIGGKLVYERGTSG